VSQGFFSFADLSVIEPDQFQELSGLTAEECDEAIAHADAESLREEEEETKRKALEKAAKAAEAQVAALDRMTGRSLAGRALPDDHHAAEHPAAEHGAESAAGATPADLEQDAPIDAEQSVDAEEHAAGDEASSPGEADHSPAEDVGMLGAVAADPESVNGAGHEAALPDAAQPQSQE
jgi:N utilization substance protein A